LRVRNALVIVVLALAPAPGCARTYQLGGQAIPRYGTTARPAELEVPAGMTALHYYGSGGWGIRWRQRYLLLAPYFSNHGFFTIGLGRLTPDRRAVARGLAGTPVGTTTAVVIGHGHVDHAGDVPAYFGRGLVPPGQAALIADRTTVNILEQVRDRFSCRAALDHRAHGKPVTACATPGFRIVPLHSDHAPHLRVTVPLLGLFGFSVGLYAGVMRMPLLRLPSKAQDFPAGATWAYLIDLLDEKGEVAFRIHYMDAAASPPHGLLEGSPLAARPVDVHIACVPGFDAVDEYPQVVLQQHGVRYALLGHWEDFFRPQTARLRPVPPVLDEAGLARFVRRVERVIGVGGRGLQPEPCPPGRPCGPRGQSWALPVPGETYRFVTGR
jgi:hypothetical protein